MKILTFHSYESIKPLWNELNQTYKDNELTFDWTAHKIIWENFYHPRNASLMIIAGMHRNRCIAIFPLISENGDTPPCWSISEDFIISREYFCSPSRIHLFRNLLPEHWTDDMSCFYQPRYPRFFQSAPGGIVDIKNSPEEYFASLKKKSRHALKRVEQMNSDILVKVDDQIYWTEINGVLESQLDYWRQKAQDKGGDLTYSRDKIHTDLKLMERAQHMGKLIAIYLYMDNTMVAANFSVRREKDRVDDYLCLRNCGEGFSQRGLGFYAILKNMEVCRELGIRSYDFSSCSAEYKRRFINTESFYYYLPAYPETRAEAEKADQRQWNPALVPEGLS